MGSEGRIEGGEGSSGTAVTCLTRTCTQRGGEVRGEGHGGEERRREGEKGREREREEGIGSQGSA